MEENRLLQIIIGFITVLGMAYFLIFYDNTLWQDASKNTYTVVLKDCSGVKIGQNVGLGGYTVGFVKDIILNDNYSTNLIISIDNSIKLTTDAMVMVAASSLFATGKTINLVNGIEESFLDNNSTIYNSNVGIDLYQLLDLVSYYINSLHK